MMTSTIRTATRALSTLVVASALASASLSSLGCGNKAKEEEAKKAAEAQAQAAKDAEEKATAATKKAEEGALDAKHAADAKKVQSQFDASDRKSAYLKEKAAKATGAAKKNAEAAVAELDKRRSTANESIKGLQGATGAAWDTAKAKADEDVASFGKAVESLEQTVATK